MINICIMFVALSIIAMVLYNTITTNSTLNIGVFTYNTIWNGMLNDPKNSGSLDGTKCMIDGTNRCQEGMIERIHHYFNDKNIQFVCLQECPVILTSKILNGFQNTWNALPHRKARGMITFYRKDSNITYFPEDSIHGFFVNDKPYGERPFIVEHFNVSDIPTMLINVHPGHPGYGDYTYFDKHIWEEIKKNPILKQIWVNKKSAKLIAGDWNSVLYNKDLTFGGIRFVGENKAQQDTCCASSTIWPSKKWKPNASFDNILCSNNMKVVSRIRDMKGKQPYRSDHIGVVGVSSIIYSY